MLSSQVPVIERVTATTVRSEAPLPCQSPIPDLWFSTVRSELTTQMMSCRSCEWGGRYLVDGKIVGFPSRSRRPNSPDRSTIADATPSRSSAAIYQSRSTDSARLLQAVGQVGIRVLRIADAVCAERASHPS
ncbi:hypothetical protein ACU5JM_00850 (plasmid) [Rhodococcus erythropolis]|uniref:hypothetical protein n=1 Tax=Rhodococcus erythropolis TaxID=1833 RepID=UPI00406BD4E9